MVCHPYLFALFTPLSLYSGNMYEVSAEAVVWAAMCILSGAWIAKLILTGVLRLDNERAGVLISFGVMIFFCYGHFLIALRAILSTLGLIEFGGINLARWPYAYPVWIIFALMGAKWLLTMKQTSVRSITLTLNAVSAFLLLSTVAIVAFQLLRGEAMLGARQAAAAPTQSGSSSSASMPQGVEKKRDLPDVYYIFLDGYASEDTLKRVYALDNSQFYDFLQGKGFFLAKDSHSNYLNTDLSIPSALNMTYLDFLARPEGRRADYQGRIRSMFLNNDVFRFFQSAGYSIQAIAGWGFSGQAPRIAGYQPPLVYPVQRCRGNSGLELMSALMQNSVLCHWQWNLFAPVYREHCRCLLSKLAETVRIPGPKFIYFHILIPHPPFVFGPNGESRGGRVLEFDGHVWDDKEGYIGQVKFINKEITRILEIILRDGSPNPIIVMQGDHGPQSYGMPDLLDLKPEAVKERAGILNAYLVPDHAKSKLYPSITPVNSFRLILKQCFNADYDLLDDKTYAYWPGWFEKYLNITDLLTDTTRSKTPVE